MDTLPLFGFRQWMTGSPTKQVTQPATTNDASGSPSTETIRTAYHSSASFATRTKQAGIRENSEESCDLPKSSDIMQHLAERARELNKTGRRHPSYSSVVSGSAVTEASVASHFDYDALEAEIDSLKEDVMRLRQEADRGRTLPKTEEELASDRYLSTRSKRGAASTMGAVQSAAARLQQLHEAVPPKPSEPATKSPSSMAPPSPLDFPALGRAPAPAIPRPNEQRRPSYASAATSGMMSAIQKTFSNTHKAEHPVISLNDTSTDAETIVDSAGVADDQTTPDHSDCQHGIKSSPSGGLKQNLPSPSEAANKHIPHFAQPTKAFARRADETLRKDPTPSSPKSPHDGLTLKKLKAKQPNLSTAKRALEHQQKRKSLPTEWANAASQKEQVYGTLLVKDTTANDTAAASTVTKTATSPSGMKANGGKENITKMKVRSKKNQPLQSADQKNSGMPPMTVVDTRDTPKKQKSPAKKCSEAASSAAYKTPSESHTRPGTPASATSSVCFILDRTNGDVGGAARSRGNSSAQQFTPSPKRASHEQKAVLATRIPAPGSTATARPISAPGSPRKKGQSSEGAPKQNTTMSPRMSTLPNVPNTTTKRRTSHGHLLKPIFACLDSQGLLNKNVANNAAVEAYLESVRLPEESAPGPTRRNAENETPCRRSEARSGSSYAQVADATTKALPPHIRKSRDVSGTSSTSDSTLCQQILAARTEHYLQNSEADELVRRDSVLSNIADPASTLQPNAAVPDEHRKSSLVATAKEFRPSQPLRTAISNEDIMEAQRFIPDEEWHCMRLEDKMRVLSLREQLKGWGTLKPKPLPWDPSSFYLDPNNFGDKGFHFTVQPAFPPTTLSTRHTVQAGQVLTPTLSLGKKNVQWMMKDLHGRETPVRFGRAPPPPATPVFETPTASSTPDDLPLKTPSAIRGWRIGSASPTTRFAWKGGDGKEISFSGYGPYAERDPNTIVNFNFNGIRSSYATAVPNGFAGEQGIPSPGEFVAPRSRRQWAEKLGYSKIPCGNMEITHAVEQMPFGSEQLAGYCFDCAAR